MTLISVYSFCGVGRLSVFQVSDISQLSDVFQVSVSFSTNQLFSYCEIFGLFVVGVKFHQKNVRTIIPIHTVMAISMKKFFLFMY